MSSFSYNLKEEVASIIPVSDDESLSELSAIIKTSGEITRNGKTEYLTISTEHESVAKQVSSIIKNLYGYETQTEISNLSFSKNNRYKIIISNPVLQNILKDTEIAQFDEDKFMYYEYGISSYMIDEEQKELAFLRGVFVGCFSCNINLDDDSHKNHTSSYHSEFVFSNKTFAQDFCFLLADFDILSKLIERKNSFVVYVKGLDMISDLLALVGAKKGMLKLQNESVVRSIRNNINRQNNCISANLSKVVDASIEQMKAIDKIRSTIGIENLDENLKEVAYLRLANPEESLDSLVKLSNNKISKSGLYHRFKKLQKIADDIK